MTKDVVCHVLDIFGNDITSTLQERMALRHVSKRQCSPWRRAVSEVRYVRGELVVGWAPGSRHQLDDITRDPFVYMYCCHCV